jgi:hypothetical protein
MKSKRSIRGGVREGMRGSTRGGFRWREWVGGREREGGREKEKDREREYMAVISMAVISMAVISIISTLAAVCFVREFGCRCH